MGPMAGSRRIAAALVALFAVGATWLTGPAEAREVRPANERPYDTFAPDLEIHLNVGASNTVAAQVRDQLRRDRAVARFGYLDPQAAYAEFTRIFASDPGLVASVKPTDLPASFRVALNPSAKLARFDERYLVIAGVDEINSFVDSLDDWASRLAMCSGPRPAIAVFLSVCATGSTSSRLAQAAKQLPDVTKVEQMEPTDVRRMLECALGPAAPEFAARSATIGPALLLTVRRQVTNELLDRIEAMRGAFAVVRLR